RVVAGAADEWTRVARHLPGLAGIVRAPHRSLTVRLDQRVDPLRIRRRDGDADFADRRLWHAVHGLRPCRPAIVRDVHAAPRAAALDLPRVHHQRPHAGDDGGRILRIERQTRASRVGIDEEDALPALTAVRRPIDAALLLRP